MILIHYNTAFKALDEFVRVYNQDKISLSEKLRQAPVSTAKEIIRIYGSSLLKANAMGNVNVHDLPSLRTNNVQLAQLTGASSRTVQRHINKLQEVGIITRKEWHGTNASYELWINPKIVLSESQLAPKPANEVLAKSAENGEKRTFENDQTSKCPHTETGNIINNIIIGVDKWISPDSPTETTETRNTQGSSLPLTEKTRPKGQTGNTFTGNTEERDFDLLARQREEKLRENGGENESYPPFRVDTEERERSEHPDEAITTSYSDPVRSSTLKFYVDSLWTLAKNVLYKDIFLTDFQIKQGKQLLYDWYEPVATQHLSHVHQIYVERISITRKFVERDPARRFVQLPFKFFNTQNPTGFAGTKKWWNQQQKRNQEVQQNLILQSQIKRFLNNEKKDLDQKKPSLKLFRECETRIGKLGNPQLLEQFHSAVMNHQFLNRIYN